MQIKFNNKDESFFRNNGYLIKKTNNIESLNYLRQKLVNFIFLKKPNIIKKIKKNNISNIFNNLHRLVKIDELNSLRIFIIDNLNKDINFAQNYHNSAKEMLEFLVGNELAMQNRVNLSIQMPEDNSSLIDIHSDAFSGETPFQVVQWIPLVDVYDTKSMFILSPEANRAAYPKLKWLAEEGGTSRWYEEVKNNVKCHSEV